MSKAVKLDVFMDITCPFCYGGYKAFKEAIAARPDVAVTYRPVEAHPYESESEHKPRADLIVKAALYIKDIGGDDVGFYERAYHSYFEEGCDVANPFDVIGLAIASLPDDGSRAYYAGLSAIFADGGGATGEAAGEAPDAAAEEAANKSANAAAKYDEALRRANNYAYAENGVWAVPTFVSGDKRLDAVEGVGVTPSEIAAFLASL